MSRTNLSWWMMREMASNRTAFFALECWTFLDLGGSWALLRMVSRHSVRRLRRAASSATTNKQTNKHVLITSEPLRECSSTSLLHQTSSIKASLSFLHQQWIRSLNVLKLLFLVLVDAFTLLAKKLIYQVSHYVHL